MDQRASTSSDTVSFSLLLDWNARNRLDETNSLKERGLDSNAKAKVVSVWGGPPCGVASPLLMAALPCRARVKAPRPPCSESSTQTLPSLSRRLPAPWSVLPVFLQASCTRDILRKLGLSPIPFHSHSLVPPMGVIHAHDFRCLWWADGSPTRVLRAWPHPVWLRDAHPCLPHVAMGTVQI